MSSGMVRLAEATSLRARGPSPSCDPSCVCARRSFTISPSSGCGVPSARMTPSALRRSYASSARRSSCAQPRTNGPSAGVIHGHSTAIFRLSRRTASSRLMVRTPRPRNFSTSFNSLPTQYPRRDGDALFNCRRRRQFARGTHRPDRPHYEWSLGRRKPPQEGSTTAVVATGATPAPAPQQGVIGQTAPSDADRGRF